MSSMDCASGKTHRFDRDSGWCEHGCGVRDDRRVISRAGMVIRVGRAAQATDDIRHRILKGDD